MSRTAGCFLALGFVVTLAAACGDDDGGSTGNGGSAGGAGRGGAAGAGGRGGAAGASAGRGGAAGAAGSTAGRGGSSAGQGGSSGSTAGRGGSSVVPDDAGADASDGSVVVTDAGGDGTGSGACPNFATAAGDIEAQDGQEIVIARVLFNGDGTADVVLRNPVEAIDNDAGATNFPLIEPHALCSGPNNCQLLEDICVDDDDDADVQSDEEVTCTIEAVIGEGELAVLSNDAEEPAAFAFAYIQWASDGDFVSPAPAVGDGDPLETRAVDSGDGFWATNETITVDVDDDAIVATGDSITVDDFESCEAP